MVKGPHFEARLKHVLTSRTVTVRFGADHLLEPGDGFTKDLNYGIHEPALRRAIFEDDASVFQLLNVAVKQ